MRLSQLPRLSSSRFSELQARYEAGDEVSVEEWKSILSSKIANSSILLTTILTYLERHPESITPASNVLDVRLAQAMVSHFTEVRPTATQQRALCGQKISKVLHSEGWKFVSFLWRSGAYEAMDAQDWLKQLGLESQDDLTTLHFLYAHTFIDAFAFQDQRRPAFLKRWQDFLHQHPIQDLTDLPEGRSFLVLVADFLQHASQTDDNQDLRADCRAFWETSWLPFVRSNLRNNVQESIDQAITHASLWAMKKDDIETSLASLRAAYLAAPDDHKPWSLVKLLAKPATVSRLLNQFGASSEFTRTLTWATDFGKPHPLEEFWLKNAPPLLDHEARFILDFLKVHFKPNPQHLLPCVQSWLACERHPFGIDALRAMLQNLEDIDKKPLASTPLSFPKQELMDLFAGELARQEAKAMQETWEASGSIEPGNKRRF